MWSCERRYPGESDIPHPLRWEIAPLADGHQNASNARPSYPNWQRKRIQNPCSVSSNLTEGTSSEQATSTNRRRCSSLRGCRSRHRSDRVHSPSRRHRRDRGPGWRRAGCHPSHRPPRRSRIGRRPRSVGSPSPCLPSRWADRPETHETARSGNREPGTGGDGVGSAQAVTAPNPRNMAAAAPAAGASTRRVNAFMGTPSRMVDACRSNVFPIPALWTI